MWSASPFSLSITGHIIRYLLPTFPPLWNRSETCLHRSFHYQTEALLNNSVACIVCTGRHLSCHRRRGQLCGILFLLPPLHGFWASCPGWREHLAGPQTAQLMWELRACLEIHANFWKLELVFPVSLTRVMLVLQIFLWWQVEAEAADIRGLPARKSWLVPICYWSKEQFEEI